MNDKNMLEVMGAALEQRSEVVSLPGIFVDKVLLAECLNELRKEILLRKLDPDKGVSPLQRLGLLVMAKGLDAAPE